MFSAIPLMSRLRITSEPTLIVIVAGVVRQLLMVYNV